MITVPSAKLSQPRSRTWNVRKNTFPFGVGPILGTVEAQFKPTAQSLAEAAYGRHVVVEPAFRNVDKTEDSHNG